MATIDLLQSIAIVLLGLSALSTQLTLWGLRRRIAALEATKE
jgi:hypothetical protein